MHRRSTEIKIAITHLVRAPCALIVEDDVPFRAILKHMMASFGFSVWDVNNGDKALSLMRQARSQIDLALIDTALGDGLAVAAAL